MPVMMKGVGKISLFQMKGMVHETPVAEGQCDRKSIFSLFDIM